MKKIRLLALMGCALILTLSVTGCNGETDITSMSTVDTVKSHDSKESSQSSDKKRASTKKTSNENEIND